MQLFKTRSGLDAAILAQDAESDRPLVGAYRSDGRWYPTTWKADGTWHPQAGYKRGLDLLLINETPIS